MIENISQDLRQILSEIIKISIFAKQNEKELDTDKFTSLLDDLFVKARKEADHHITNLEFQEAAEMYYFVSKILEEISKKIKNQEFSELLESYSVSWSLHSNSLSEFAISSILEKVKKIEKENNQKTQVEATILKDRASILKFELQNGFLHRRLDEEALNFIRQREHQMVVENESQKQKNLLRKLFPKRFSSKTETIDIEKSKPSIIVNNPSIPDILKIKQKVKPIDGGLYDWCIYLDTDEKKDSILHQIESVKYDLHPTFPDPAPIKNSNNKFMLNAKGWGEFEIKANILLKDGQTITKYHWLNLNNTITNTTNSK